ncbi:hypothetical protein [Dysgonomonas mossii]|uniref:hypothetical protein n=1 Tax=Dysgonomonas mossii TaxID=163665 RepID=UPI003994800A
MRDTLHEAIDQSENEIPLPKIRYKQKSLSIDKKESCGKIIKGKRARLHKVI